MKQTLTVQMLVRDSRSTIHRCLESLKPLSFDLLVGDLGSRDGTPTACAAEGARVVRMTNRHDLSKARTELAAMATTPWSIWINPNEFLLKGHEEIVRVSLGDPACRTFGLFQDGLLTKPVRMWHKDSGCSFRNRVFEVLSGDAQQSEVYLSSTKADPLVDLLEACGRWHADAPLQAEPIYYLACAHLQAGNVDSFLNYADAYLHAEKNRQMSYYMTKYHIGLVHCYKTKDFKCCLQNALQCVAAQPTMSEFWCLLGDAHYEMGDLSKARSFYENALILGKRRSAGSLWPMHIEKYRDHPEKMIESCRRLVSETKVYGGRVSR